MTIRLGVIGLGQMAQRAYLPVLSSLETVELAAVMSRRVEVVERIRAQYRLPAGVTPPDTSGVPDLADLARLNLDAAVVLTPSPTHFEIVKRLLEADLDVLVEKPATISSRETAALGELAEQRGRVLMVAFNRRFAPLYRRAKELFSDRKVTLCVAEKHRERAVNPSLLAHYYEEDIHMIDLLRWYGGQAQAVATRSQMRDGKLVDAASLVAFEHGGVGVMAASLQGGGWLERVTLHGESLTVQADAFREMRVLRGNQDEVTGREMAAQWITSYEVRGFSQLIGHFIECVQKRQTPLTSALESFNTQKLLEDMVAADAA